MAERGRCMVRYADDFVILCRTREEADAALAEVRAWVSDRREGSQPAVARLVRLLQTCPSHHLRQARLVCQAAAARRPAQAGKAPRAGRLPGRPSTLAKCLLRGSRAVRASHGLVIGETVSMKKPPTGEPYARKPPVRLCVQRRLACSAGERPAGAMNQRPRSLDRRVAGNQDSEAYRQRLPRGDDESPGRNNSERKSGLESA
jgi:hypothetical protein